MSEKLTADGVEQWNGGYKNFEERPYVYLDRAQAALDAERQRAEQAERERDEAKQRYAGVSAEWRAAKERADFYESLSVSIQLIVQASLSPNSRDAEFDVLQTTIAGMIRERDEACMQLAIFRRDLEVATLDMKATTETTDEDRLDWLCKQAHEAHKQVEELQAQVARLREALTEGVETITAVERIAPGYDWNADRLYLTLIIGKFYQMANSALTSEPAARWLDRERKLAAAEELLQIAEHCEKPLGGMFAQLTGILPTTYLRERAAQLCKEAEAPCAS